MWIPAYLIRCSIIFVVKVKLASVHREFILVVVVILGFDRLFFWWSCVLHQTPPRLSLPPLTALPLHRVFLLLSVSSGLMECRDTVVSYLSWALVSAGVAFLLQQTRRHTPYGRYRLAERRCCPARLAWFLQEVPAFLLPLLLLLLPEAGSHRSGRTLLLCAFMLHYFHRWAPIDPVPHRTGLSLWCFQCLFMWEQAEL